ncbi:MAG: hypothetical protein IID46_12645 [Planctomycetes bacterium]|nr:hypothetical protein [Planctomycetota bacterium]
MSPRSSEKKSKLDAAPDIYVGLLFVSVAALMTGIIFLAMELSAYNWEVLAQ